MLTRLSRNKRDYCANIGGGARWVQVGRGEPVLARARRLLAGKLCGRRASLVLSGM